MPWVDVAKDRADGMSRDRKYGEEITSWLEKNFPEFGAHPAAIAAVIRLHYMHGRGNLTKAKHGDAIRAAVKYRDQALTEETA